MSTKRINGFQLEQMLKNGLAALQAQEDEINRLNVFPVSDGDKIVISTKKTTDQYDASYNWLGSVTDTDSVTVTIAMEKSTPTNFIRAIIQAIIAFIKGLFANLGNLRT